MLARPTRRLFAAVICAVLLIAGGAYAQFQQPRGQIWVGNGGFGDQTPRWPKIEDFDGTFVYCRGFYESNRPEPQGQGWRTDYPGADNNFAVRLAELTKASVHLDEHRLPRYVVVALDDPLLFHCPMLFMEDVGTAVFTPAETEGLRKYLLKGGFLSADDFWGTLAWDQWAWQIGRVLPPNEYPIVDLPLTHPMFHSLYVVNEFLQVPSIQQWRRMPGVTGERGTDSLQANFRAIMDKSGRVMVIMRHNSDIPDTWEREGEEPREFFDLFSPKGYAIGVNAFVYSTTH